MGSGSGLTFLQPLSWCQVVNLNPGSPHRITHYLWGTQVQAESPMVIHPGKHRVNDLVGQLLHLNPDIGLETKK